MSATPARAAASLHQRILGEIEDSILSGRWAPGHRIPSEQEFSASYGCSRMTVNKALTQLAQAGLIERRRKAGSFVRRPQSQSAVLQIVDIKAEVVALGLPYAHAVVARQVREADGRTGLGPEAGGPVLDITCRHFAGDQPFCLEQRLINLATVPEAADAPFEAVAPGAWLAAHVPWTTAEHRIRAVGADEATARQLGLRRGTACLVVERRTWGADRPVTFVRLTYPGAAHELVARFTPALG